MLVNIIQNTISSFRSALAAAEVITTNLKMWLGFETNSIDGDKQITPDKSGNNNVGELFTGKALEFDGSTDYVDVDGFKMSGNVSTFAFWINSNDTLGRMIDINPNRFIISFNNNQLSLYDGSWKNFGTISTNVWNRCVVVTNGTSAKCYVNGVQLGVEKTINAINIGSATDTIIGANVAHNQSFFDGEMSDFQIYNAAWSTDDIAYDYANPNKLAIDNPSTSLNVTNLKAYWALSEGDGLVAYDSGTNLEEEEVVNGDFATDSDWSEGTGWDIDEANNKATHTGAGGIIKQTFSNLIVGRHYVASVTLNSVGDTTLSNTSFQIRNSADNGSIAQLLSQNGEILADEINYLTLNFTATQVNNIIRVYSADNIFVTDFSVKELTASDHGGNINGADYVLNQPRIPQLGMMNWSEGSNSLTFSEDFSNSVWTKGTGTSVTGGFTDPLGGNTAYKASYDGVGIQPYIFDDLNNTTNIRSVWARTVSGTGQIHLTSHNSNSNSLFNLTTEWQRVSAIPTSGAGIGNYYLVDFRGSSDLTEVLVWGTQIDDSPTLGGYRPTSGTTVPSTILIPNPTIPTKDIFGSLVRDRLNSFNLGKFGGATVDAFTLSGKQATIQLWFKNVNSNDSLYLADLHSATDRIVLGFNSSQLSVFHEITGGWQNFGTITDGDWNFATFTFDGTSLKCFVGTSQLGVTKTITAINLGTTTEFGIGMNHFSGTRTQDYNGHISDFLIYDRVLTSDEVENNYNAGLSAHTN